MVGALGVVDAAPRIVQGFRAREREGEEAGGGERRVLEAFWSPEPDIRREGKCVRACACEGRKGFGRSCVSKEAQVGDV